MSNAEFSGPNRKLDVNAGSVFQPSDQISVTTVLLDRLRTASGNSPALTEGELAACVAQGYLRYATLIEIDSYRTTGNIHTAAVSELREKIQMSSVQVDICKENSAHNYALAGTFLGFLSMFVGDPWARKARSAVFQSLEIFEAISKDELRLSELQQERSIVLAGQGTLLVGTRKLTQHV
jgi:hypothetical protein